MILVVKKDGECRGGGGGRWYRKRLKREKLVGSESLQKRPTKRLCLEPYMPVWKLDFSADYN